MQNLLICLKKTTRKKMNLPLLHFQKRENLHVKKRIDPGLWRKLLLQLYSLIGKVISHFAWKLKWIYSCIGPTVLGSARVVSMSIANENRSFHVKMALKMSIIDTKKSQLYIDSDLL